MMPPYPDDITDVGYDDSGDVRKNPEQENSSTNNLGQSSCYRCASDIYELRGRVDTIEKQNEEFNKTIKTNTGFIKKSEQLLLVFQVVLILFPILSLAILAICQYIHQGSSSLINVITTVIGLANIAECIILPRFWKTLEDRIKELERKISN